MMHMGKIMYFSSRKTVFLRIIFAFTKKYPFFLLVLKASIFMKGNEFKKDLRVLSGV